MDGRTSGTFGFHSSLYGCPSKKVSVALDFTGTLGIIVGLGAEYTFGITGALGVEPLSLKNPQITVAASASMTAVTIKICRLSRLTVLNY